MTDTEKAKMPKECVYRHENGNCLPLGGFCAATYQRLACTALREYDEHHNPRPLTLEELRERVGKPVCKVIKPEFQKGHKGKLKKWVMVDGVGGLHGGDVFHSNGVTNIEYADFYDHEPKEQT